MVELKTLKDLIKENDDELTFGGYTIDVLRDEAINWIKDFHRKSDFSNVRTVIWIEDFFNISEEDLE